MICSTNRGKHNTSQHVHWGSQDCLLKWLFYILSKYFIQMPQTSPKTRYFYRKQWDSSLKRTTWPWEYPLVLDAISPPPRPTPLQTTSALWLCSVKGAAHYFQIDGFFFFTYLFPSLYFLGHKCYLNTHKYSVLLFHPINIRL